MNARARPVTTADIMRHFGEVDDHVAASIIATGAIFDELEVAAANLNGEAETLGYSERPLTGLARAVHDIVRRAEHPLRNDWQDRAWSDGRRP